MQCPVSTAVVTEKHSKHIPKLFYWIVGLVKNNWKSLFTYIIVEGRYQRVVKSFMSAFRMLYHKMLLS